MIGRTNSYYKITRKPGEGGIAVVCNAENMSLDCPVVLKFLAAHRVADEDARGRFEREEKGY